MGTWGPGVFENDYAWDFLNEIDDKLIRKMREIDRDGFDSVDLPSVLAAAAMLAVHREQFRGGLPEDVDLESWEARCVTAFDRDAQGSREEYRTRHRHVIVETFDKLKPYASTPPGK